MYPDKFISKLDEPILNILREITETHDQNLIRFSPDADFALNQALGCKFEMLQEQYYKHCIFVLVSETIKNEKEIRQLKNEVETLKKEVNKQSEIISTYNGSYLQRAKVKSGVKIAKKNTVTKEAIQQLKGQNLTINQIANKLGCSRTTVWRRLNG